MPTDLQLSEQVVLKTRAEAMMAEQQHQRIVLSMAIGEIAEALDTADTEADAVAAIRAIVARVKPQNGGA